MKGGWKQLVCPHNEVTEIFPPTDLVDHGAEVPGKRMAIAARAGKPVKTGVTCYLTELPSSKLAIRSD